MEINKDTKIGELIPEGYELSNARIISTIDLQDGNDCTQIIGLHSKVKSKTPEQLANELAFRIGDRCWDMINKDIYHGSIISFKYHDNQYQTKENLLVFFNSRDNKYITSITNKVAIHCKNKKEFEFLTNLIGYTSMGKHYKESPYPYVCINENCAATKGFCDSNNYLILSVDEYCASQGIKPLFVTEDGVNIYEDMKYYMVDKDSNIYMGSNTATCDVSKITFTKYFSTEQAAKEWLAKQQPKFEVRKWYVLGNTYELFLEPSRANKGFKNGEWVEDIRMTNPSEWKLANPSKVEELLLAETRRRYNAGTKVRDVYEFGGEIEVIKSLSSYIHKPKHDEIWLDNTIGSRCCVYNNDKWAKIISEPKPLTKEEKLALYKERDNLVSSIADRNDKIQQRITEIDKLLEL